MDIKLYGNIETLVGDDKYVISGEGYAVTVANNAGPVSSNTTLLEAIKLVKSIYKEHAKKQVTPQPGVESKMIGKMEIGDVIFASVEEAFRIYPLLTYYKRTYGREFNKWFENIEGVRKLGVKRIEPPVKEELTNN